MSARTYIKLTKPSMDSSNVTPAVIAQAANVLICDRLRAGGTFSFTISTSSMLPALGPGDRVVVRAARADRVRTGDIVIRKMADSWIAHRVIDNFPSGNETHLVTKGDNVLAPDPAWEPGQLVGAVIAVVRAGQSERESFTGMRRSAIAVAFLSRSQLFANHIRLEILRSVALRSLRACLRVASWVAR
jgi:signal peptidase I